MKWETVKLGELYSIYNGLAKGREFFGKGYPFISFSEVFNNIFLPSQPKSLVESTETEREKYSIKRGDILITRTSETPDELGMTSVALQDIPNGTYNGFSKRLRPITERVLPEFIGYYLRSFEFRKHFIGITGSMTTRASLRNEFLLDLDIPVPDYKVQQKIAHILYSYDLLINNCQKQIYLLEEAAQRLYKEWFVDFRFPGHESVAIVDGQPDGWIIESLENITSKFATGLNPRKNFILGNGTNYYITIKNMAHNTIILDDKCDHIDDDALSKINKRSDLKVGDLLFSGIGTIGRVHLIQDEPTNWNISESVFTIRPNDRVSSYFLYLLLLDDAIQTYAQNNAHGCAQKGIRMADLKAFTFHLPTSELLDQFDARVKPLILTTHILRKQITRLTSSRDTLLPRLMSGEIEIKI